MKHYLILACSVMLLVSCQNNAQTKTVAVNTNTSTMTTVTKQESIHQFKVIDLYGKEFDFSTLKGKKILIVNTASECGLTPQYKDLESIYSKYKDKNFVIVGFPANNFGGQEPWTNEEIKEFCSSKFGVTFMMMDKISVKGDDKAPLYKWLSDKDLNGWNDKEPTWNFCKYFINEKGELVKFFASSVKPMDEEILQLIAE